MPELPEVETTLRGLEPHLLKRTITRIEIRQPKLRWPVPDEILNLQGATIQLLKRRAKYLLVYTDQGNMIWHLGMSGSMRMLPEQELGNKHEHIKIILDDNSSLRYIDPRRFGALLHTDSDPLNHKLICTLGPEPLSKEFNANYLKQQCLLKRSSIKQIIMDSHIVVGIGNIYACESLFLSGINPKTKAKRISIKRIAELVQSIKSVLQQAILQGGTTLQDFTQTNGQPGYFAQKLHVYGNKKECLNCGSIIKRITQAQRSTFYCSCCQR